MDEHKNGITTISHAKRTMVAQDIMKILEINEKIVEMHRMIADIILQPYTTSQANFKVESMEEFMDELKKNPPPEL